MIVGGRPRRSPISSLSSLIWVSVGLVVSPNPNLICVLSTPVEKNCRRFWDRPRSSVLGRDHLDSSKIFIVIFSAIVQWEILSRLRAKVVVRFVLRSGNVAADFLDKQGAANGLSQVAWVV
ncbi:hypothetical protein LWI28_001912 [Acer negundo]|uniref:Uncharacterized protein n=1 Tax=Acer negundo TaxID=4023 RepID=A0AAD5JMW4_ACENE|nr:hypothetical protein LWI28_001912 [Acer negundo]